MLWEYCEFTTLLWYHASQFKNQFWLKTYKNDKNDNSFRQWLNKRINKCEHWFIVVKLDWTISFDWYNLFKAIESQKEK